MDYFPVKRFSGIETKFDETDQDRGTLRRADGVVVAPRAAISSGPTWAPAWDLDDFGTQIETALSGADTAKVHFVTVARSGFTILVAWDLAAHRTRGARHDAGTGNPTFSGTGGVTITATNNSTFRDKTAALNWYGSWIGDRLFLCNGTDTNLVWESGALAVLFPGADSNEFGGNKVAFPPVLSFVADDDGVIYGAGGAAAPLTVYASERPSAQFPKPFGIVDTTISAVVVRPHAGGTAVTALSINGPFIVAHLDRGGAVALFGWEQSSDGYKCQQKPTAAPAGALNPACAYDRVQGPFYVGTDLEVYRPPKPGGWRVRDDRSVSLFTDRSDGDWNRHLTRPAASNDTFSVFDEKNGCLWLWAPLAVGRQGLYVYDSKVFAVTGPFRYPDFLCVFPIFDPNVPGCLVAGITRDGALLYADLNEVATVTLPEPGTAQGADFTVSATSVSSDIGLPGVEIDADNEVFRQTLNGETVAMQGAWSEFAAATPAVTQYFKNASLAVVDIVAEDFGTPVYLKDFCAVKLQWRHNQRVYAGVYCQTGNDRDGRWLGCPYPDEEQEFQITLNGTRLQIRLILVFFNGSRAVLPDISVGLIRAKVGR